MTNISIAEIERDPIGYLRRVEEGEAFTVLKNDRPVAEIKPIQPPTGQVRPYGLCAGEFTVPADFDQPLPEDLLRDFEAT